MLSLDAEPTHSAASRTRSPCDVTFRLSLHPLIDGLESVYILEFLLKKVSFLINALIVIEQFTSHSVIYSILGLSNVSYLFTCALCTPRGQKFMDWN